MKAELYIGLMSGTSMDGIDAVLARFGGPAGELIGHSSMPWPREIKGRLRALTLPGDDEIERLGPLDIEVADAFAETIHALLRQTGIRANQVRAVGSHGQTVRHRPNSTPPFTLQIGDPNRIAELTGIDVVADFRRRDIAAGGQGAPLVPAYHAVAFSHPSEQRFILNIGGIANITRLPGGGPDRVSGYDTGPGNTLLNHWAGEWLGTPYDADGAWAATGKINEELLEKMLEEPYFTQPAPKSTGPEQFSPGWLERHLDAFSLPPQEVQATLTALTAESIARAIAGEKADPCRVVACGGGVFNRELMRQLRRRLAPNPVDTTADHGMDPSRVEAMAFAWLARQTLLGLPGNLPAVTGASHPVVLGGIYPSARQRLV